MTPEQIEALARRAGVKLEDGAPLWSEVAAMLALVRAEALEDAAKVCDGIDCGCAAAIRALAEVPAR